MGPTLVHGSNRHQVALGWVRHDEALTKMAAACWSRDRFTDVTIFCEDRALHAHRLVLASMSPLLANLLADAEGSETALMLPEVKADDMKLLLQFIYQGEVVLPPRRTAALLDLAALLCVAGVRGGGGPTPPSPPRSDSPELDAYDHTGADQVSEDEHHEMIHEPVTKIEPVQSPRHDEEEGEQDEGNRGGDLEVLSHHGHLAEQQDSKSKEMEDMPCDERHDEGPMNLAARPEIRTNGTITCSRPKPCSSSPPDFNYFSSTTSGSNHGSPSPFVTRFTESRSAALSYYQHPALRGCHPFSLELAVSHRNNSGRTATEWATKRKHHSVKNADHSADSDVEVTVDIAVDDYDSDREIDLSIKPDMNRLRPDSTGDEKLSPSSDLENSSASNESIDQIKGRNSGLYLHSNNGSTGAADMRLTLADKMLLLPPAGNAAGSHADPRRTYLEAVLQESLVQQSYTIVLPSHLGVTTSLPVNPDNIGSGSNSSGLGPNSLETKAWNLASKSGAVAAAAAELQCLQGLFNSRVAAAAAANGDSNFGRNSVNLTCNEGKNAAANLTTNKNNTSNGNGINSTNSNNSSKRNGKEGYSCQVCRKVFTSSSNLAVHSMIHSGTKPFKCDLCSWSFRQKAHLQKHMRHIHKIIVAK